VPRLAPECGKQQNGEVMANALTPGLVTVLASGVGAGVVTFALNSRRAEKDFRRTKLEALYLAIHKYVETMTVISLQLRTSRRWKPNDEENVKEHVDMINLLIDLYFRPLLRISRILKRNSKRFFRKADALRLLEREMSKRSF
jgi:hypothetical protein